tara:strand:- start:2075 stop:3667 length:1593 start_codon:yes stop_codon:yes gene_type:complete
MFVQVYSMLEAIKKRDNKVIDVMVSEFDHYGEQDFIRPQYDSKDLAKSLVNHASFEIVDVITNDEEKNCHGFKVEKGSFELWVKFKDIKIRRRKIFRLGDYYLRLVNNGYSKTTWKFYTKEPIINNKNEIEYKYVAAAHPHIQSGIACMADWETEIKTSFNAHSYIGGLEKMQMYLNTWTYNSPHYRPEVFERSIKSYHPNLIVGMFEVAERGQGYNFLRPASVLAKKYDIDYAYSYDKIMLPSARKKAYDSEPLGRTMLLYNEAIKPLNEEKIEPVYQTQEVKTAWMTLFWHFDEFCDTPSYAELTQSEKFVVTNDFVKIMIQNSNIEKEYDGKWTDSMSADLRRLNQSVSGHYSMYFNKKPRHSTYSDSFSFSPSRDEKDLDLKSKCFKSYTAINSILNELHSLQDAVYYGGGTKDISSFLHSWMDCWEGGKKFNDYMEMLDYARNLSSKKQVIDVFKEYQKLMTQAQSMYDEYEYLFNLSYKKKLELQYAELSAYVENYEREAKNGNENNHSEESTSTSETLTESVS